MACFPPSHCFDLQFRPYRRPFARPLQAAWGTWSIREGILLRLENTTDRTVSFGEIAPLPAFGSEDIDTASAFMASFSPEPTMAAMQAALDNAPPATAFGLWSAMAGQSGYPDQTGIRSAALLPLDASTPDTIRQLRATGFRTFKLKLGLNPMEEEWEFLQDAAACLQGNAHLRLDPNQSWDGPAAAFWFSRLEGISEKIEFVEEPYREGMLSIPEMVELARHSPVPLALDESLSRHGPAQWLQLRWPGFWIIKPSLMGSPDAWRMQLQPVSDRLILSSVFETGIGLGMLARLANGLNGRDHGLGTEAWFDDAFGTAGGTIADRQQEEKIWNQLPNG